MKQIKELEFINVQQENLSISKYEATFMKVANFVTTLDKDYMKKDRYFESVLSDNIIKAVKDQCFKVYYDVVECACVLEHDYLQ